MLTVPEDYANHSGSKIQLPYIVFSPFKTNRVRSPLLVAGGGGPGNGLGISKSDSYGMTKNIWYDWYSSAVDNRRALILVDNRGVGSSNPRLNCDEVEAAELQGLAQGLSGNSYLKLIGKAYRACRTRMTNNGIQLKQYNVSNAARDIEELRVNLGYKKLNIYGVSYGTRVAMMYQRMFPSKTRTLILDGVYPLFVKSHEEMHEHDKKTFDNLFSMCVEDIECNRKVGAGLKAEFESHLKHLESEPVTVTVTRGDSYMPTRVVVTPEVLVSALWSATYDEEKIKNLPRIIRSILSGATDHLAELVREEIVVNVTSGSLDEGAYASYSCYDEIPFADIDAALEKASKDIIPQYLNTDYLRAEAQLCDIWNVDAAPADIKRAEPILTPMLLYSGKFDPTTPPQWAERLRRYSRNSWLKIWPNISHEVMSVSACADWVAADFLNDPHNDPFDLECVQREDRFIFNL